MPAAFVAWVSSGSLSGQWLPCIVGVRLRMSSWLLLGSAFGVVAFVCFPVFLLPPLPIQGRRSLSSVVFPLNSLFSVTGAWFGVWGGGRGSWLDCRLGTLMGCSTDLGLGCGFQSPDPWAPNLHLQHPLITIKLGYFIVIITIHKILRFQIILISLSLNSLPTQIHHSCTVLSFWNLKEGLLPYPMTWVKIAK